MERTEAFKKEFKALLEKYDASIYLVQDGEGYSATVTLEVDIDKGKQVVMEEFDTIDRWTFKD